MAKPEKLGKKQYESLAAFRYALRRFIHFSELTAGKVGLTPQQHQAMLAIKGFPGRDSVAVGELAERLQLRHHSAVGLINRMVAEKLVEREMSRQDRRKVLVRLTAIGERKLERLSAMHRRELKQVAPELSELLKNFDAAGK